MEDVMAVIVITLIILFAFVPLMLKLSLFLIGYLVTYKQMVGVSLLIYTLAVVYRKGVD